MFSELTADELQVAIQPLADQFKVDILDIELKQRGDNDLLVVIVEGDEAVDLDILADLSEAISQHMDEADLCSSDSYELEVTTPGVDRPLTRLRQWRRNRGRLIKATVGGEELVGRIGPTIKAEDEGDNGVVLIVSPPRLKGQQISLKSMKVYKILLSDIENAIVQVEFKVPRGVDVDAARDDEITVGAQWFPSESVSTKENK